ncbi:MAG TPA: class I SAM-dependent methyltransferase [Longimicrobiales bacterium]|nr:class I SAM-dependent methyltransferase [Longimicrobiales bacterium]
MPDRGTFQAAFNCLWCGRPHKTRSELDLEGYALLCSDCVGRAQENEFLRFRLRQGLQARTARDEDPESQMRAYYAARAPEYDDWYLRRGRYSHGPISDMAWQADLDAATMWLDGLPMSGEIVELAAGTGWWSPLLAQKGELSIYDAVEQPLDIARERLLAHGLRAHIHVHDAWAEPDRQVDALFTGFWLSHVPRARLADFLAICRRWLKPGGIYAFIDSRRDPASGAADNPAPADDMSLRRLADGREFRIPKVFYEPDEIEAALLAAGFDSAAVKTTSRFFLLGRASA